MFSLANVKYDDAGFNLFLIDPCVTGNGLGVELSTIKRAYARFHATANITVASLEWNHPIALICKLKYGDAPYRKLPTSSLLFALNALHEEDPLYEFDMFQVGGTLVQFPGDE